MMEKDNVRGTALMRAGSCGFVSCLFSRDRKTVVLNYIVICCLMVFATSKAAYGQCAGFPPTVVEKNCDQYPALANNTTLYAGDTVGFCPPDTNEVSFSGVNLYGGAVRICGNTSISGNFNSGTIVVQCGATLRIPSSVTMNNGVMIVNYGTVQVDGDLNFQNVNNAFYNEKDSSRLLVAGNFTYPQNSGQNAYFINRGYVEIGGRFDALDGGFSCFSGGSVLQCNDFTYVMNCGGPSNRFTHDGSAGVAIIGYANQANIRANLTTSSNIQMYQAAGSSVSFGGCGSFGSATLVPNAPALVDPGSSNTNCISNCFTILPVEVAGFEADCIGGEIALNWTTVSESNSSHFVVQRSTDGTNYTNVGILEAAGFSQEPIQYNWSEEVIAPTHYYRLKQVDLNGASRVCGSLAVQSCREGAGIYPNPCEDWIALDSESAVEDVTITDGFGNVVFQADVLKGEHIFVGDFASGIYFVTVGSRVYKLVKRGS